MNDTVLRLVQLKKMGYCCSQMMMILALETQKKTNPDLVRSIGGLCFGVYGTGEACGALTGGACLISMFAGKGTEEEISNDRYISMIRELSDWFHGMADEDFGGVRCDDILRKFPDRSMCAQIVADTYEKCMAILAENGLCA
ncbi:MAG TPA: C-GCAxxG-C-C family protein [Syntrophorhabdaceae bacterium]|nr:C-GCAxxG-C-C family protein [Syntrophorhabdaceae bacterium]